MALGRFSGRVLIAGVASLAVVGIALTFALGAVTKERAPEKPLVDTEANCDAIRAKYLAALAPAQACSSDDECVADQRGRVSSGLDGCARFRRRDADLSVADAIAKAWLARGCSRAFMTCREERAQCERSRCTELPPEPVPRTWRRVAHDEAFSFFVPPGTTKEDVLGEDSEVGYFRAPGIDIHYDYGRYGTNIYADDAGGEVTLVREPFVLGDAHGEFVTTKREHVVVSGVHFPELHNTLRDRNVLTLWGRCKTVAECADMRVIARSLELH